MREKQILAGAIEINFATKGQLRLFMDSLWSLITLISSFIGKKYLGYCFVFMLF